MYSDSMSTVQLSMRIFECKMPKVELLLEDANEVYDKSIPDLSLSKQETRTRSELMQESKQTTFFTARIYAARSLAKWKKSTEEPVTPYL